MAGSNTMARSLAVLGTGSDVGKSLVAAGLCRLLYRAGIRVAPFKAQNMSLNSFVTADGGEMGRAQVLQAQACGLAPHVDMNPILLKPEADNQSQVIVLGKVWDCQKAHEYFEQRAVFFQWVQESYARLARQYQVMVIEGAGSAAEMNLRDRDIVNWPVVEMADAKVILVADIERGGVFAQIIGTMDLLAQKERRRVIGVVINKFRGDVRLFDDGVKMIEERAGIPVLGVLPYLKDLELDQEDSVEIASYRGTRFSRETVNIAVVLLPHMSNFTDFNPLAAEPDVALRYAAHPRECDGADVVFIPGSKTTMADLTYITNAGFRSALQQQVDRGGEVLGICGGFQMLGREIADPYGVENGGTVDGLGLLEVKTTLFREKKTVRVQAFPLMVPCPADCLVEGYEIHVGATDGEFLRPAFQIMSESGEKEGVWGDGAIGRDGLVWGTYIHGMFDRPEFRRHWLNRHRQRKGLSELPVTVSVAVSKRLSEALDRWADHLAAHVDIPALCSSVIPDWRS